MSTLTQPADAHLGSRREFKNRHSQLNLLLELPLAIIKRLSRLSTLLSPTYYPFYLPQFQILLHQVYFG